MLYHDVTDPYLDEATSNKIEDVTDFNNATSSVYHQRNPMKSPEISGGPIKPKPAQDVAAHQKDVAKEVLEGGEVPENEDANRFKPFEKNSTDSLGMKHVETSSRPLAFPWPPWDGFFGGCFIHCNTLQHIATWLGHGFRDYCKSHCAIPMRRKMWSVGPSQYADRLGNLGKHPSSSSFAQADWVALILVSPTTYHCFWKFRNPKHWNDGYLKKHPFGLVFSSYPNLFFFRMLYPHAMSVATCMFRRAGRRSSPGSQARAAGP